MLPKSLAKSPNPHGDDAASAATRPPLDAFAGRRHHARDLHAPTAGRPQGPRPRRRRLQELARHPLRRRLRPRLPQAPCGAAHAGIPLRGTRLPGQSTPRDVLGLPLRLHRDLPPAGVPACQDRPFWHVLDSRHGLVLFYTPRMKKADFVVCDLVTGKQWKIKADRKFDDIMWWEWEEEDEKLERIRCNAAVFCANDRCDHLDCHGGPFRIALVGSVMNGSVARATLFSSETREWSDMIEVQTPDFIEGASIGHSAVVGNKVYVPCVESDSVVEYNMDEQKLSVIDSPDKNHPSSIYLVGVEDGMPLFASVKKPRLYLWSMDVGSSGAVRWARHRIIELEPLPPPDVLSDLCYMSLVGFAEGVSVIFLSTKHGLYTIDLNSGERKKVHDIQIGKVMPYMSFYTGEVKSGVVVSTEIEIDNTEDKSSTIKASMVVDNLSPSFARSCWCYNDIIKWRQDDGSVHFCSPGRI